MVLEKQGIHRNPKTILRIMEKYNLLAEIRRRRKWVNMVQQIHKYENLLNRQFHADSDNAMAENFFSILKTECIYRQKPTTFSEANEMIERYIHFYNYERIQLKTGEAPLTRRLSA